MMDTKYSIVQETILSFGLWVVCAGLKVLPYLMEMTKLIANLDEHCQNTSLAQLFLLGNLSKQCEENYLLP